MNRYFVLSGQWASLMLALAGVVDLFADRPLSAIACGVLSYVFMKGTA